MCLFVELAASGTTLARVDVDSDVGTALIDGLGDLGDVEDLEWV